MTTPDSSQNPATVQSIENTSAMRLLKTLSIVDGLVTVALGLVVLRWPTATLVVLAVLFGVQLLILGVVRIVQAARRTLASASLRIIAAVAGVLTAAVGVICMTHPFTSLRVLILLIAAGWLIDGVGNFFTGVTARAGVARLAHVVTGVVSVVGALILVLWPDLSLLTLVTLAGWLLIVLGVVELVAILRRPEPTVRGTA
ncbi:MAG: HdeD family acid-resistance protein [Mycobacteriaceae bacterium]|jgi:uncharacterized membrane protein HdeD (DUF308 family)